jgi:hypothetical protein
MTGDWGSDPLVAAWASWCLTYLLHSTLLLLGAWLLSRALGMRRLMLQEAVLKGALVGAVVTTTLQMGWIREPASGELVLGTTAEEPAGEATGEAAPTVGLDLAAMPLAAIADEAEALVPVTTEETPEPGTTMDAGGWMQVAAWAWACVSLWLLVRLGLGWMSLRRLLRGRMGVYDPAGLWALHCLLRAAGSRRKVRQSASESIRVPIAFGTWRPEICVPGRVVRMSPSQRASILAHELAHLLNHDPIWTWIARAVEAIFFFQPLNRLVARRMSELSEYIADDCAVRWTGDSHSLAYSLTEVATWVALPPHGLPVPAMAGPKRVLRQRVKRIVGRQVEMHTRSPWFKTLPLAIVGLVGLALTLPRVSSARWDDPEDDDAVLDDSADLATVDDVVTLAFASGYVDAEEATEVLAEAAESDRVARRRAKRARKKAERKARRDRRSRKKDRRQKAPAKDAAQGDITIDGEITIDGTQIKVDEGGTHWEIIDGAHITVDQTGKQKLEVHIEEGASKRRRGNKRSKPRCVTLEHEGFELVLCNDAMTDEDMEKLQREWNRALKQGQARRTLKRDSKRARREFFRQRALTEEQRAMVEQHRAVVEEAMREQLEAQAQIQARIAEARAEQAQRRAERARELAEQAKKEAERARKQAERVKQEAKKKARDRAKKDAI